MYPEDLRYTAEHEWVRAGADGVLRIGITHYAQDSLGDIVYVSAPAVGATATGGDTCGEAASTKRLSAIYAPVSGAVVGRNEALDASPELMNSDPYGDGWLIEVRPTDAGDLDTLMTADAYRELVEKGH